MFHVCDTKVLPLQQETPEAKQAAVTNRIREAVNCGLKVLEEAFERLEAPSTREGAAAGGGGTG